MTKETLLGWGLSEEQAQKVLDGLNGSFVTKVRFDEVNTELTAAKKTIKERDTQLETLKKASGDTKALQDQIIQLQADNKKKDDDHAAELKNLRIGNAVELALTGARAKTTRRPRHCWLGSWKRLSWMRPVQSRAWTMRSRSWSKTRRPLFSLKPRRPAENSGAPSPPRGARVARVG